MRTEIIGTEGWLRLGDEAERLGFGPDVMVDIVVLSSGNLLIQKTEEHFRGRDLALSTLPSFGKRGRGKALP